MAETGRPRIEMDDKDYSRLIAMIRIQCTQDEICGVLDMSPDTLDRRIKERGDGCFADLRKKHGGEGKASLRRMQWKSAEDGNVTMQIWLGKQNLGQSDKQAHELTGKDGGPVQTEDVSARDILSSRLAGIAAGSRTSGNTEGAD